jgi:diaminohydroxyphosphoribosylaminopyrimidine deaminase/5-amino-6-(5-phosphoribosylamino)uracil reductase
LWTVNYVSRLQLKILKGGNTLIAYAKDTQHHADKLNQQATLLNIPGNNGRVCLKSLLSHLASLGINELMVEAGQTLNGALLVDDLVDELIIYYAPVLLGSDARGMLAIPALQSMKKREALKLIDLRQFGQDLRVIARPIRR